LRNVIARLRTRPKSLPCKYFYDERGSELFDRICQMDEYYLTRSELSLMDRFAPEIGALGDWLVRAEWIGQFLDRAQTLGRYAVGPDPCLKNSNLFPDTPENDPITGIDDLEPALCPVPSAHEARRATFEFQKLVESETSRLRNVFRFRPGASSVDLTRART
jgi:hypothetical protein